MSDVKKKVTPIKSFTIRADLVSVKMSDIWAAGDEAEFECPDGDILKVAVERDVAVKLLRRLTADKDERWKITFEREPENSDAW